MQQIADWLAKLGLGQYAQRFADNDISFRILSDLTDQDLEKIGVASLGHRRELLRAIAQLKSDETTVPNTVVPQPTESAERRHVTVMFCDLVGSTGIAAKLDAEEWRDLMGAYLDAATAAVTEMGGRVAKKLGDGLMAVFGYPVAHENDAERAVRAALSIQRALAELNRKNAVTGKLELTARIGLDAGPSVVDMAGEIYHRPRRRNSHADAALGAGPAGEGQLVLIVGEPGVGKSRLIEEFHAGLREVPHSWVEWNCSQLLQNTPLHPIAEWGRQRFGSTETPAEQRLADLENTLAQVKLGTEENAALLAPLLDIPLPPERAPAFPPAEIRRRQLTAMTNWLMAGARSQPIVLALEDIHWADPTTLDLLSGIAERGALAPLFVVITARPEFRPPWGTRSHHSTISLAPLDRRQVRDMISELAAPTRWRRK